MPECKRKLKKVDVNFISLVDKGANQKTVIYKSDSSAQPNIQKSISIKKFDEELGIVYGIVYSPNEVDSQGDTATAEVIRDMSDSFMKNARTTQIDKQHNEDPDQGFVCENWITKSGDNVFPTEPIGSWAVGIKIEDDETKEQVKKGEITGLSLSGLAVVEMVEKSDSEGIVGTIKNFFKEGLEKLRKDFASDLKARELEDYIYALYRSNDKVLYDEQITDKKAAIITNVKQFLDLFEKLEVTTTTTKSINKTEEVEMNAEEIKALVEQALKPISEKIDGIEKAQKDNLETLEKSNKDLTEKVEKLEKATPGSKQVKKTEEEGGEKEAVRTWI
jgi:hypothetical protein